MQFVDPSRRDEEESAFLFADLDSDDFLVSIESFVGAVHKFKNQSDHPDTEKLSISELKERVAGAPQKPKYSKQETIVYARDPYVAALAKRRARGRCDLCRQPAPFTNADNEPYLECHHMVQLAHGGADNPQNTVALCPNRPPENACRERWEGCPEVAEARRGRHPCLAQGPGGRKAKWATEPQSLAASAIWIDSAHPQEFPGSSGDFLFAGWPTGTFRASGAFSR